MSSENELKEGNIQQSEENEGSGEIEGYRNYNKRITNVLKTACDEHIPIGETMLQIMQRVEDEGEV